MSEAELNPTLRRQLRRLGLSADSAPDSVEAWQALLARVDLAYTQHREGEYLLQRSLDTLSNEMRGLYDELSLAAESRVAMERDRLMAIITGLTSGFATVDTEGHLQTVNPAGEQIIGPWTVGQPLLELLRLSDEVAVEFPEQGTMCAHLMSGATIRDDLATITRGEGVEIPVSVQLFPITVAGEVSSVGMMLQDISELLQSDHTQRRLARAVDASAEAIYTTDAEGIIEYVNSAFTAITGYTSDDAVGATPRILQSGKTPATYYERMWRVLRSGQVWQGRLRNRRKPGSHRPGGDHYWAQSTISPYFAASGELLGYVSVQRDITAEVASERRRAAESFAASLRAEIGRALQLDKPLRSRIDDVLEIMERNFSAATHTGFAAALRLYASEVAPKALSANGPSAMPAGWEDVAQWPALGAHDATTVGLEDAATQERLGGWVMAMIPIIHAQRVIGCLVMASAEPRHVPQSVRESALLIGEMIGLAVADAAALRQAQIAREAAIEATGAKSKFLANMSHEIRTPMNGVLGMLDMLRHTELSAKQQDYVSIAFSSSESLLTVINDILDFSKIEAGKVTLESVPFDLRATVEDVATLFSAAAADKGVEVVCFVPPEVPTGVRGDPTRLRQILSNVIGNAVKFTEAGEVVVRVSNLAEPPNAPGQNEQVALRIEITDTGIGMSPDAVNRLFEPFAQADSSMTRRFGGTGLGLAIARQLVELMGGSFTVHSVEGQGTTFGFDLTLPRQPEAEDHLLSVESLAGARALVVDDLEINRLVLEHYLRDWDLELATAQDGLEAWQMLQAAYAAGEPFQIVLLDMQMPRMDGGTLTAKIRADPRFEAVKLVCVSSVGLPEGRTRDWGFDLAMTKPVRQSVVHDVLMQLAGQSDAERQEPVRTPGGNQDIAGMRVLLAEDNAVNRNVAVGMLELLGVEVDVAPDGQQALERLAGSHFDLVLMDCQMPVLDGFAATRRIRAGSGPDPDVTIVAMTANAMAGDRERCIEAGMNDYISKPFTLDQLAAVFARWAAPTETREPLEHHNSDGIGVINEATLNDLRLIMGDQLDELLAVFEVESGDLVSKMETAVEDNDSAALKRAAHSLKSSAAVFGAAELSAGAAELEASSVAAADLADPVARVRNSFTASVSNIRQSLSAGTPAPPR